jgi:SAM-dependent methyltransferase
MGHGSIEDMFANALGYEALMGRWSVRLGAMFLDFAGVQRAARILDVGCGTGSLVLNVLDRMPRCEVVGIDPGSQFIDFARSRITSPRAKFDLGDALRLPYEAQSFDCSLSLLVFMFLKDPAKGAAEMRRVTRPGGIAAACTWDRHGLELTEIFSKRSDRIIRTARVRLPRYGPRRASGTSKRRRSRSGCPSSPSTTSGCRIPGALRRRGNSSLRWTKKNATRCAAYSDSVSSGTRRTGRSN